MSAIHFKNIDLNLFRVFLTLMQHVKEVERLTIRAVVHGERSAAVGAFAAHPLIGSEALGEQLLAGYEAAFPELQRLWGATASGT